MKKGSIRTIIAIAAIFIVYNVIVFAVPFNRGTMFWVSYVFTLVAFAVAAVAIYRAFLKSPDIKSKFYGFPIAKIGVIYWAAQAVVSIIFMILGALVPVWVAVIIYAIGLGVAAVGLVSADAVVEEIHVQDQKLKKNISMMRTLQSKVNQMEAQCSSPEAGPAVKKLAEEFRYSDPVSGEALEEIEAELASDIDTLQQAVIDGDTDAVQTLCRKTSAVLAERNRLCKLNK